jgi:hypothetical protein
MQNTKSKIKKLFKSIANFFVKIFSRLKKIFKHIPKWACIVIFCLLILVAGYFVVNKYYFENNNGSKPDTAQYITDKTAGSVQSIIGSSDEDYKKMVGTLPDSYTYFMKANTEASKTLALGGEEKYIYQADLAKTRLLEAYLMLQENKPEKAEESIVAYISLIDSLNKADLSAAVADVDKRKHFSVDYSLVNYFSQNTAFQDLPSFGEAVNVTNEWWLKLNPITNEEAGANETK